MKNLYSLVCIISCLTLFLHTSCEKAEDPIDFEYQSPTAVDFLRMNVVPAVMFTVNTYSVETEELTSFIIDNKGKVRLSKKHSKKADEFEILSTEKLESNRDNSDVIEKSNVDLEALVESFKLLAVVDGLSFDHRSISQRTKTITSVYGFYYRVQHDEFCVPTNSVSSSLYDSVLLAQGVDGEEIQSIPNAKSILDFLSQSILETSE